MYLPKPPEGGDFTPPPAGSHLAICYRVLDLGTQLTRYMGEQKSQHKIMLSWELPEELTEDGQPFSVHQRYTFSMHEKATLRKHLEAWRGKAFEEHDFGPGGFEVSKLLGQACLISITHTEKEGKTYANVASVSALPKAMRENVPAAKNDKIILSLDPGEFNADVFGGLSEGLKDVIKRSPEYAKLSGSVNNGPNGYEAGGHDDLDDDIPF